MVWPWVIVHVRKRNVCGAVDRIMNMISHKAVQQGGGEVGGLKLSPTPKVVVYCMVNVLRLSL